MALTQTSRPRGRKRPSAEVLRARHAAAFARHDHRNLHLPKATAPTFDARTLGWIGPVQDQGQCGDCWNVSATGVITNAYIKAGLAKNDGSFVLSPQYVLDQCGGSNGGCSGDDAPTVLALAKSKGLPTAADYGPYTGRTERCRYTNQKLYPIADWGYCTPSQQEGIATVQDVKNAIAAYGAISSAIVADDSWDSVGSNGLIPFNPSSPDQVDHDISLIGWDDTKVIPNAPVPGAYLGLNQWGTSWGDAGFFWVGYGSNQVGTEAAFVVVSSLPPVPPPPGPQPPSPQPAPAGTPYTGTLYLLGGSLTFTAGLLTSVVNPPSPSRHAGAAIDWAALLALLEKYGSAILPLIPVILADLAGGASWLQIVADITAYLFPASAARRTPCGC